MITIIFESHATTVDNEARIASGLNDVALSSRGIEQARQLGQRYKNEEFDVIFCSALERSYQTAKIAFADRQCAIVCDARLNECNYGQFNGSPASQVESLKAQHIDRPFPQGDSYLEMSQRIKSFLVDLLKMPDARKVMIIGHRATQYGLEHWIHGVPLQKAVLDPWQWQPGWTYRLSQV
jgi:broad specificity phosphatase PhoE